MILRQHAAVAAAIVAILAACILQVAGIGSTSTRTVYTAAHRVCYPLQDWSTGTVSASRRPCARIVQVFEDGSVRVQVSDAAGTVRWSAGIGARDR